MDIIELIDKHLSSINIISKEVEDEFILDTNIEYHKKQLIGLINNHLEEKYKENQDIIISHKHFVRNYLYDYFKKIKNINKKKGIVNELMKLDLPDQRTEEWYKQRKKVLTASSLATACNKDHFKTREELILDKISIEEKPFVSNPITEWGVKYEEIATKFYESINDLKILEFGMIPHYEFKIFGASPDGICSNDSPEDFIGRMLEIKCPPKRKFTKTVPEHYKMQVLGQLECCGLDVCDFLQVKLEEYENYDEYKNDIFRDIDDTIKDGTNNLNLPKGSTITYKLTENSTKLNYLYPELYLNDTELDNWMKEKKRWILNKKYIYVEAKYWKIIRYECTLVKRDEEWWLNTCPLIIKFWQDVEYYKNNKTELLEIIESKKKRKRMLNINDVNECLID